MKNLLALATAALLVCGCHTVPQSQSAKDIKELKAQVRLLQAADKAGDKGMVVQAMCRIGELELDICEQYGYK